MDKADHQIECSLNIVCAAELRAIGNKWTVLETSSTCTSFLNWSWIDAWRQTTTKPKQQFAIIEATLDNNIVGLAIFGIKIQRPVLGISIKQLWLHRCGSEQQDQVWIEHNDFLLSDVNENSIRRAMLQTLLDHQSLWDELYVGMARTEVVTQFDTLLSHQRCLITSPSYQANLSSFTNLQDYLDSLSSNSRSQINRSQRRLEALGQLSLSMAETEQDKQDYLQHIAQLHIEKWDTSEHGSGFTNPLFVEFHEHLLLNDAQNQATRLYKLTQNDNVLGYVYLLTHNKTWYFYLSAISLHPDPKIKVGALMHCLIIEQAIKEGVVTYDFLAGQAQYKSSLSNTAQTEQQLVCYFRPTLYMLLRESLRKLKNRFMQRRQ
jgi:CelD/BcsL family acetyltransferase involved in cellulose biosynthesis